MTPDLPKGLSLEAEVVGDQVRFVYVERLEPSVIDATLYALRRSFDPLSVTVTPVTGGIEMRGQVPRVVFGNMMAMEFFGWGSVGEMKMRDVFVKLSGGLR